MHRKEIAKFQLVIISFIKKWLNRKWGKDSVLKKIEKEEKKLMGGGRRKMSINSEL
jgi:hypothetical protein